MIISYCYSASCCKIYILPDLDGVKKFMLSYRHGFHAGNFADVFKHILLINVLQYLNKKDKAYMVVDTHSGAGEYRLDHVFANKTQEYQSGVSRIMGYEGADESIHDFVKIIRSFNTSSELQIYPGSPQIIKGLLRHQDFLRLFELHPADFEELKKLFLGARNTMVFNKDVLKELSSVLPPHTRRGVIFMDPSYEMKSDYIDVVHCVIDAWKMFKQGVYMIWYPVVKRAQINNMKRMFEQSFVKNIVQIEFQLHRDNDDKGMTGNGFFIINPPWVLENQARKALPDLLSLIGNKNSNWSYTQIVPE